MSVAYYIVLEDEVPGLDPFVNGKAIAHAGEKTLAALCRSLGVRPLTDFVSEDPDELAGLLDDDGFDMPGDWPQVEWFDADQGLATVRALQRHLVANPDALHDAEAIVGELVEYALVLEHARDAEVRWRLALDF